MKILLLTVLTLLASCDTLTRRHSDEPIESVRVVYSDAGGLAGLIGAKTSSCTIIASEDTEIEVTEMTFNASANECTATVKSKED